MFQFRFAPAILLAAFLTGVAASPTFAAATSPDVDQLLTQIRATLIRVQTEIANNKLPALKSVQITLQTAIRTTVGGKITFFVISLGDTVDSERAQSIKITLTPPDVRSANVSATENFSKEFAAAIIAVSETIARSAAQKPALILSNLTASIKFTSEATIEGGVTKVQLLPISIDLGGKVTPTNTHEAVLVFGSAGGGDK